MENHSNISWLLDFYGDMLKPRQRDALVLYYNDDLSLSEVARELNISRQGVRSLLLKGEETLREYENALGLAGKFSHIIEDIAQLRSLAADTKTVSSQRVLEIADDIEKYII